MNNKGDGRYKHNSDKKRAIAIKHCASLFTEALPRRIAQLEDNKQKEGSRMAVFHRQTSDLCEADVRQMNHADISDEESDDDFFAEEDLFRTPEKKPTKGRPGSNKSSASKSPASRSPASRSPANSVALKKPTMKSRTSMRSDAGGSVTPEPGTSGWNAVLPAGRKTTSRGGANLYDIVTKAYEHHVAEHDLFAEFLATESSASTRGIRATPARPELMRLTSNDKYVLDYGARFRDLMEDNEMSTEAKCFRIYA